MTKIAMACAAVATLAVGFGCKNEKSEVQEQREELAKTQVKANENVAEIRKDTAEKKAELDREAAKDVAEARGEVAEARKDVVEAQHDLAHRDGTVDGNTLSGTVASTLGNRLVLRDANGVETRVGVDDQTRVTLNGKTVKMDDLKKGTPVRASYIVQGNDKVARNVESLSDTATGGSGIQMHDNGHAGTRKGPDPMDIPAPTNKK